MPRLITEQGRHTSPLVWLVAIVCAILVIAVIIFGIVVFAIYIIYQPKMPFIKITYASLNKLDYDQFGMLDVEMTLTIVAENDNSRVHASFSDESFLLQFHGIDIAELRAEPFDVPKNRSFSLTYEVPSSSIPLDKGAMETMDAALKKGNVTFDLNGKARTRWRVGIFVSLKTWTHLSCPLQFSWPGGSSVNLDCSSKSH